MELHFDRGDPRRPKGHALVYFRGSPAAQIQATYVVVMPIPLELGKYLPPLLAARLPELGTNAPSVVPMPPVPEQVAGIAYLRRLAEARDDDLIDGGTLPAGDLQAAMQATADLAQRYQALYNNFVAPLATPDVAEHAEPELNAREVVYSIMGEHDRLQELSKLTGQLRYAVDGADARLVKETVAEMERLGKFLPPKYRGADFIRAAQIPGDQGRRLAALYMDRCYKLYREDYAGLAQVEAELKNLEAGS